MRECLEANRPVEAWLNAATGRRFGDGRHPRLGQNGLSLADALAQSVELSTLISELVHLARENGSSVRDPLDVGDVAEAAVERAGRRHDGVEFRTDLGSLTLLGDEDEAPTGALLFTKPLGPNELKEAMKPEVLEALVARSPLGVPAVPGVLFRVKEPANAETAFRAYGLLRPLTDREVPPTMRKALPTDKSADPTVASPVQGPKGSVAPPGF